MATMHATTKPLMRLRYPLLRSKQWKYAYEAHVLPTEVMTYKPQAESEESALLAVAKRVRHFARTMFGHSIAHLARIELATFSVFG